MDKIFINRKLEFLTRHLESLKEYKGHSLDKLKKNFKDLKYIEKLIQELVDCAVDINQFILETLTLEKSWSSKQSFRDLENKVLKKHRLWFEKRESKLFIDTVTFRNEIVHSYDISIYIIWGKRDINVIIELYRKYFRKIMDLLKKE